MGPHVQERYDNHRASSERKQALGSKATDSRESTNFEQTKVNFRLPTFGSDECLNELFKLNSGYN